MGIVLLGLIVILFLLMNFALPFNESDNALRAYLAEPGMDLNIESIQSGDYQLRLVNTHKKDRIPDTTIVFIHGAPGSLSDFKAFLRDSTLLDRYNLVAIDRPGYGSSNNGKPDPTINGQAKTLMVALSEKGYDNMILVGHSYGGPIIAKMAIDAPNRVKGLLLLAPVNEAESEPKYKISYLAVIPPIKWLVPGAIYSSAVEKLKHPDELASMEADWKKIQCKTIQMHGDKDFLAPPSNMAYTQNLVPANLFELIRLKKENHFLPWTQFSAIKEVLTTKF